MNKIIFEGELISFNENINFEGYTLKIDGISNGKNNVIKFLVKDKNQIYNLLTKKKYSKLRVQGHLEALSFEKNGKYDRNKIYLIGDIINDL